MDAKHVGDCFDLKSLLVIWMGVVHWYLNCNRTTFQATQIALLNDYTGSNMHSGLESLRQKRSAQDSRHAFLSDLLWGQMKLAVRICRVQSNRGGPVWIVRASPKEQASRRGCTGDSVACSLEASSSLAKNEPASASCQYFGSFRWPASALSLLSFALRYW